WRWAAPRRRRRVPRAVPGAPAIFRTPAALSRARGSSARRSGNPARWGQGQRGSIRSWDLGTPAGSDANGVAAAPSLPQVERFFQFTWGAPARRSQALAGAGPFGFLPDAVPEDRSAKSAPRRPLE